MRDLFLVCLAVISVAGPAGAASLNTGIGSVGEAEPG